MATTNNIIVLVIGRLIEGIAIGIASMNAPLYISEVCPMEIRGKVVALYTLSVVFGQFFSNVIALILLKFSFGWRILISISVLVAVI